MQRKQESGIQTSEKGESVTPSESRFDLDQFVNFCQEPVGILTGIILNPQINLRTIDILMILSLQICELLLYIHFDLF